MKKIRIAVTALTGRIVAGSETAKGNEITEGSRQDVTSDFMKAVIDKAEYHGGSFVIEGGDQKWEVTVKDAGAEPSAPNEPERSPKDYAIEHAEYMAKSADHVLEKFQAYSVALLLVDEGGDDGEGELLENIDSARDDLQEALVDLRSMIYEFRKRSAKSR